MPGIPINTNYSFLTLTNPLVCRLDFTENYLSVGPSACATLKSDLLSNINPNTTDFALLRLTDISTSSGAGSWEIYYGQCGTGLTHGGKLYRIYAPNDSPPIMKECETYEFGNLIWPLYNGENANRVYLMVLVAIISYTAHDTSYSYTDLVYSTAWFMANGTNDDITCNLYIDQINYTDAYYPGGIRAVSITFYPKYGYCPTTLNTDSNGIVSPLISSLTGLYSTGTIRFNEDIPLGTRKYVRTSNSNQNYQWKDYLNLLAGTAEIFNSNTGNPATATNIYKILVGSATFNGGSHKLFIHPCWYLLN